jgi:hypothetical protein
MKPSQPFKMTTVVSNICVHPRSFAIGLCVGMGATCFNAPFDVVKSRFQVSQPVHMHNCRHVPLPD